MKRAPVWGHQVGDLRELAAKGLYIEEIAPKLPGRSRNAIYRQACMNGIRIRRHDSTPNLPPAVRSVCPDIRPAVREALAAAPTIMALRHQFCTPEAWERQLTAYVAHVELGAEYTAIARLLSCDRKMVAYAVGRIEERRDGCRALDEFLDDFGSQLAEAA